MNLHWELNGLDWHGTSATATVPNLELLHDAARERHGAAITVTTETLEQLADHQYAVLWYSRPAYDLLVIPESDPQGVYTLALVKHEAVEQEESGASQFTVLRAVIDFCATDYCEVSVAIVDRQLVPYDVGTLAETPRSKRDRGLVTPAGSCSPFVARSEAILPGSYYHASHEKFDPEPDLDEAVTQRIEAHKHPRDARLEQ